MIKSGLKPHKPRHKNYDFIKTFHPQVYAGISKPSFPDTYLTDDGSSFPDQNADGLPFGCTSYASAALAQKLGNVVTPQALEAITHANERGGISIQESMDTARNVLHWFTATYEIQNHNLSWFDAFRLAQGEGIPEKRSISWGVPWFKSWENAVTGMLSTQNSDGTWTLSVNPAGKQSVVGMPTIQELIDVKRNPNSQSWHDSELDGWTIKNGKFVYRDKSWQGTNVGDNGYIYFPEEVINLVMTIKRTVAETGTNLKPANPIQTIDLSFVQKWLSYIRTWLNFSY